MFRLQADKLVSRAREIDTLSQMWQAPSREQFAIGTAPDGWPGMRIVEIEPSEEIEGQAYEIKLVCEGIADTDRFFIETDYEESTPEEGWDEIRRVVFTRDPDHAWFSKGAQIVSEITGVVIPGHENLYITDRAVRRHRANGYFEVSMVLKGIKGAKPYKRRISGNVTTSVSRAEGTLGIIGDRYEDFPPVDSGTNDSLGLSDGDEVEYDAASIEVSDTHLLAAAPPTDYVGQPWTPPDPPDVVVLTLYGEKVKKFWPFGWFCRSMPCEKLAGTNLWVVTVNYTFRIFSIPVTE